MWRVLYIDDLIWCTLPKIGHCYYHDVMWWPRKLRTQRAWRIWLRIHSQLMEELGFQLRQHGSKSLALTQADQDGSGALRPCQEKKKRQITGSNKKAPHPRKDHWKRSKASSFALNELWCHGKKVLCVSLGKRVSVPNISHFINQGCSSFIN